MHGRHGRRLSHGHVASVGRSGSHGQSGHWLSETGCLSGELSGDNVVVRDHGLEKLLLRSVRRGVGHVSRDVGEVRWLRSSIVTPATVPGASQGAAVVVEP